MISGRIRSKSPLHQHWAILEDCVKVASETDNEVLVQMVISWAKAETVYLGNQLLEHFSKCEIAWKITT
jgi:hypothetical protein